MKFTASYISGSKFITNYHSTYSASIIINKRNIHHTRYFSIQYIVTYLIHTQIILHGKGNISLLIQIDSNATSFLYIVTVDFMAKEINWRPDIHPITKAIYTNFGLYVYSYSWLA